MSLPIRSLFQPIVNLETRRRAGYEALVRGPRGTAHESPVALFALARDQGCVTGLDLRCLASAWTTARAAGWSRRETLFVNAEPATLGAGLPEDLARLVPAGTPIVVEITERDLVADPPAVLRSLDVIRSRGWGVALDDVGAEPGSAAMLPLLQPDVIKLDLRLIQARHTSDHAAALVAILAEAERTGAALLAEGIETAEHERIARSYGAAYGQGWRYGQPGPLAIRTYGGQPVEIRADSGGWRSPLPLGRLIGSHARVGTKADLVVFSRHLERLALASPEPSAVLAALQHRRHFTTRTSRQYAAIATTSPLVVVFGVDLAGELVPGVRGIPISPGQPLAQQWHVIVLGAHFAGALLAQDLGDRGPEEERRFRYRITFDRAVVIEAARALARAMAPAPDGAAPASGAGLP